MCLYVEGNNKVNEAICYGFTDDILSSGTSSLALKWLCLLFLSLIALSCPKPEISNDLCVSVLSCVHVVTYVCV